MDVVFLDFRKEFWYCPSQVSICGISRFTACWVKNWLKAGLRGWWWMGPHLAVNQSPVLIFGGQLQGQFNIFINNLDAGVHHEQVDDCCRSFPKKKKKNSLFYFSDAGWQLLLRKLSCTAIQEPLWPSHSHPLSWGPFQATCSTFTQSDWVSLLAWS